MSKIEGKINTESIDVHFTNEGDEIVFRFPKEYTTLTWLNHFGSVENIYNRSKHQKLACTFDFRLTHWADPAPLLSLLLITYNLKIQEGRKTKIILPSKKFIETKTDSDKQIEKDNPLHAFLYAHGYVLEFLKYNTVVQDEIILNDNDLNLDYASLRSVLAFPDSYIQGPILVDLGEIFKESSSLSHWINNYLSNFTHRLQKIIPDYNFKNTTHSLSLFLFETLQNIYDHAYGNRQKRPAAIYLRHRNGLTNHTLTSLYKTKLNSLLSKEQSNCPRLFRYFADQCAGYLEVFVVDVGMGLVKSFSGSYSNKLVNPFRTILDDVINKGKRNELKPKETKFGGLYILAKIIQKGFLWILDQNECFGEPLPIKARQGDTESVPFSTNYNSGLTVMARITWSIDVHDNPDWFKTYETINFRRDVFCQMLLERQNIYQKFLKKGYKDLKVNPFFIRDERIQNMEVFPNGYLKNDTSEDFILYLPPADLSKWDIYRHVSQDFNSLANPSKTLLIADIPNHEANIYQFALDGAKFDKDFHNGFERIILVTKNLSILILTKAHRANNNQFEYNLNAKLAEEYALFNDVSFCPHKSFLHLLQWLKTHDSMLFWRYLLQAHNSQEYFITGSIKWFKENEDIILSSYFNFAQTLTDSICLDIYDMCLTRATSLNHNSYFLGIDNLTKNITDSFNHKNKLAQSNQKSILLGSVYVTGVTYENISPKIDGEILINFFYNKPLNIENPERVYHLLLWPDFNFLVMHGKLAMDDSQRVGCSSVLAPNGWKYFTIPRYKHRDFPNKTINDLIRELPEDLLNEEDFISITECPPPETYKYWQSNSILSIGHYEYENYHDLFKIDLPYAFDESWRINDDLSTFIMLEFINAFSIDLYDLIVTEDLRTHLRSRVTAKPSAVENEIDLIVYPYHFSIEHIMKSIKACLPEHFKKRIVSLIPINAITNNTPYFISPQTENKIKNLVIEEKTRKKRETSICLIFDTLKISGKLERELIHILKLCGVTDTRAVFLVDRQRLPVHSFDNKSFWKFDVPVLSNKTTCPICRILAGAHNLKNTLTSDILVERLDVWIKNWGKLFRYSSDVEKHGITPIEISLRKNNKKKFSIYVNSNKETIQIGGHKNEITLNRSIGATVYCAEMLAMTTKDDVALELISKDVLQPEAIIEILAVNLLLYHNQISAGTKRKMLKKVFDVSKNISDANNHTILAALILCIIEDFDNEELLKWCIPPGITYLNVNNIDILLALCLKAEMNEHSHLSQIQEIKRLVKKGNSPKEINKQFHSELFNDYGEAHDNPLHKIQGEDIIDKNILINAYNSLLKLKSLLPYYHASDFLLLDHSIDLSFKLDNLENHLDSLKEKVETYYYMSNEMFKGNKEEIRRNVMGNFNFGITIFKEIHSNFFASFNLGMSTFPIRDHVDIIISELSDKYPIGISFNFHKPVIEHVNIVDRWIAWNKYIITIIRDILDNCKYAIQNIPDPFQKGISMGVQIENKMWVFTEYDDKHVYLCFLNLSNKKAADVQSETGRKFKPSEDYLRNIGGSINYKDATFSSPGSNPTTYLKTILKIPYV